MKDRIFKKIFGKEPRQKKPKQKRGVIPAAEVDKVRLAQDEGRNMFETIATHGPGDQGISSPDELVQDRDEGDIAFNKRKKRFAEEAKEAQKRIGE